MNTPKQINLIACGRNKRPAETSSSPYCTSSKQVDGNAMKPLKIGFVPGPMDVICGRGKAVLQHEGNIKFREVINLNLEEYSRATTKADKSQIVSSILENFKQGSSHGGFVKYENGVWYEAGEHLAREKVGQCLRDSLHSQYRSSAKAKQHRRRKEQIKFNHEVDELLVQADCKDISERIKSVSAHYRNDDEIQAMFNQANCELLQVFKNNEERARKKRKVSVDTVPSNNRLSFEPIPLNQTLEKIYFGHPSGNEENKLIYNVC